MLSAREHSENKFSLFGISTGSERSEGQTFFHIFEFCKGYLLIDRNNSFQLACHFSTKISRLLFNILCRRLQETHPFGQSL